MPTASFFETILLIDSKVKLERLLSYMVEKAVAHQTRGTRLIQSLADRARNARLERTDASTRSFRAPQTDYLPHGEGTEIVLFKLCSDVRDL